jgi:hypothetical protein
MLDARSRDGLPARVVDEFVSIAVVRDEIAVGAPGPKQPDAVVDATIRQRPARLSKVGAGVEAVSTSIKVSQPPFRRRVIEDIGEEIVGPKGLSTRLWEAPKGLGTNVS